MKTMAAQMPMLEAGLDDDLCDAEATDVGESAQRHGGCGGDDERGGRGGRDPQRGRLAVANPDQQPEAAGHTGREAGELKNTRSEIQNCVDSGKLVEERNQKRQQDRALKPLRPKMSSRCLFGRGRSRDLVGLG